MKRIFVWYNNLSKRVRDSIQISIVIVGLISTLLSILGISLEDLEGASILFRLCVVIAFVILIYFISFITIGRVFGEQINIVIRQTPICICGGNIFFETGWRVIGCDSHFDTRIDDIIIAKKSLHGQLVLNHGKKSEIESAVEREARRLKITKDQNGLYTFPLGTIIPYRSSVDNQKYLMLAMTNLNAQYEAHTNMAEYEQMLMKMWKEIDRVYAMNDVSLPVLGTGIPRFDDGPKDNEALLRCMLCTLNSSGVSLKSKIKIIIFGNVKELPLYEYKDMFREIHRR